MREEAEYWFKETLSNCGVSGSKPVLTTALISVMPSSPHPQSRPYPQRHAQHPWLCICAQSYQQTYHLARNLRSK